MVQQKQFNKPMKKPKKVERLMWAYFSPDGYIQVRSIADTKKLSREHMDSILSWKHYENNGYYIQRIDVYIFPLTGYKQRKKSINS